MKYINDLLLGLRNEVNRKKILKRFPVLFKKSSVLTNNEKVEDSKY